MIYVIEFITRAKKFTPLEKAADFNRRSLPLEANGGLKPLLAQTVGERSSLTGFTASFRFSEMTNRKIKDCDPASESGYLDSVSCLDDTDKNRMEEI